jgi:hypothetical protein
MKLIFRQVGPSSAALLSLIAKTARLKQERPLLSTVLEALRLPIEFRGLSLKFISLCGKFCYELFSFLGIHHFPYVFPPPATPACRAALNVIIADVGSMGKRSEPAREGVRVPRRRLDSLYLRQRLRRDLKRAQSCAVIENL